MSNTALASNVPVSLVSGDKDKAPPPWYHAWDQFEARVKSIDPAEPAVLCVTVRATGRVFWASLAGVVRRNLQFTLLSADQFERVDEKWVLAEEIDIQFRISKHLPLPMDLDNGRIEIHAESLTIVIHPYGAANLPGYSRR